MHSRKQPVHQPIHERLDQPIVVFLTVCTKDRKKILGDPAIHAHLIRSWRNSDAWQVGRYTIMPDHVHLFCAPAEVHSTVLMGWVSHWKSWSAIHWPRPNDAPIWQRHFWDTQLRRGQSYDEKWEYVAQNPVRAGLVRHPNDWPHQGELNVLRW